MVRLPEAEQVRELGRLIRLDLSQHWYAVACKAMAAEISVLVARRYKTDFRTAMIRIARYFEKWADEQEEGFGP